jgi:hypothetical protein
MTKATIRSGRRRTVFPPSKEITDKMCSLIQNGVTVQCASLSVGQNPSTIKDILHTAYVEMKKRANGDAPRKELERFVTFGHSIRKAITDSEIYLEQRATAMAYGMRHGNKEFEPSERMVMFLMRHRLKARYSEQDKQDAPEQQSTVKYVIKAAKHKKKKS